MDPPPIQHFAFCCKSAMRARYGSSGESSSSGVMTVILFSCTLLSCSLEAFSTKQICIRRGGDLDFPGTWTGWTSLFAKEGKLRLRTFLNADFSEGTGDNALSEALFRTCLGACDWLLLLTGSSKWGS